MSGCDLERLESLFYGELSVSEARTVEAHSRACLACQRELGWLRRERGSLHRPTFLGPRAWHLLQPRLLLAQRDRTRRQLFGGALGFALGLLLVFGPGHPSGPVVAGAPAPLSERAFCESVVAGPPWSDAAAFCGNGDLIAQAESRFEACLIASPQLGWADTCL